MARNLRLKEQEIAAALRRAGGLKCKAAELLGTTPVTISHCIKKFPRLEKVVKKARADRAKAQAKVRRSIERASKQGGARPLNPRQKRFVEEYVVGLNGKTAAVKAGYGTTPKSSTKSAVKLMKKPHIRAAIQGGIRERTIRTMITQDQVLRELALIAFSNIADYLEWDRNGFRIKYSHEIDPDLVPAIETISGATSGCGFKLKLHSKIRALELLGRHVGMFDHNVDLGFQIDFEQVRKSILEKFNRVVDAEPAARLPE